MANSMFGEHSIFFYNVIYFQLDSEKRNIAIVICETIFLQDAKCVINKRSYAFRGIIGYRCVFSYWINL